MFLCHFSRLIKTPIQLFFTTRITEQWKTTRNQQKGLKQCMSVCAYQILQRVWRMLATNKKIRHENDFLQMIEFTFLMFFFDFFTLLALFYSIWYFVEVIHINDTKKSIIFINFISSSIFHLTYFFLHTPLKS